MSKFASGNFLALAQIVGGGLQAGAQVRQGQIEADAFEFNAAALNQQAALIKQKSDFDAKRRAEKIRRDTSEQKAAFAAAGVRFSGSPLEVIKETISEGILDISADIFSANIDIFAKQTEAQFQLKKAQIAKSSSFVKAGASLLDVLPAFGKLKFGTNSLVSAQTSAAIKSGINSASTASQIRGLGTSQGSEIRFTG